MNHRLTNLIFALLLLFSASLVAHARSVEFKAGVVDIQKIFEPNYKTVKIQIGIDQERARIQKENNEDLAQLKEIHKLVEVQTRAENFTIIVEKSGATTNQVAPLLYGKGLIDITNALIAELNKKRSDTKESRI